MPEGQFAYFRFVGSRFEAEGMPLDALAELVAYREVVVDLARELWKRQHPARQRAPRHFADRLDLRLEAIHPGSAMPYVVRREHEQTMDFDDFFDMGRDLLTAAVASVRTSGDLPSEFPALSVPKLSRLGRTLGPADRLMFGHPSDDQRRAELNRSVAASLRQIGESLANERPDTKVSGHVVEMDTESETFELRTADNRRISCRYAPEDADRVREWLAIDEDEGTLVEVTGRALVDADGVIQRFVEPARLAVLPVEGLTHAFNALAQISGGVEGWQAVPAPHLRALNSRSRLLADLYPSVGIAALPDGSLRVEWTTQLGRERSAELDQDGVLFLHDYDVESGADWELETTLDAGSEAFDRFLGGGNLD